MSEQTDKFAWLRAVYAAEFKDADKAVLAYVAVFSVKSGEDTFCVRQDTLAERVGVSRETVNRAINRAKRFGFLEMSQRRKTGNGRHGANQLRLLTPESCDKSPYDSGGEHVTKAAESHDNSSHDSAQSHVIETAESCDQNTQSHVIETAESCDQNAQSHVIKTGKSCDQPDASTSENGTPTVLNNSSLRGNSSGGTGASAPGTDLVPISDSIPATQTDDPPTLFISQVEQLGRFPWCCPRHPYGTDTFCSSCKYVRMAWESSPQGLALIQQHSLKTNHARQRGRKLAKFEELAKATGRSAAEMEARAVKYLSEAGERQRGTALPSRPVEAITNGAQHPSGARPPAGAKAPGPDKNSGGQS